MDLEKALKGAVTGEVDFSTTRRAEYSADASNYRQIPLGVVFPVSADDVVQTVEVCRTFETSITMRGGGTSVAGNAIGPGVVVDCSRHLNHVLDIDTELRTVRVEPGIVLDDLQAVAAEHGLRFGPDPATHSRCTIGGMIANNACGARSVAYGRTADNVLALEVLTYDGDRMTVGSSSDGLDDRLSRQLRDLVSANESLIRQRMGRFARQISGYSLEHLLPENGFNVARSLVGTEGTCAIVLDATLQLVVAPEHRSLVVLSFRDLIAAADVIPASLAYEPTAIEGMDARIARLRPEGEAYLLVELSADSDADLNERVGTFVSDLPEDIGVTEVHVVDDAREQAALWQLRDAGAGLSTRTADGREAWPGWEDAAVPPERLGSYLRGFYDLLKRHGRSGLVYGHFGEGCVHARIDFDFTRSNGVGAFRVFIDEACRLAVEHGGSFSGEHGDGRARSEFLPLMYGNELVSVFQEFKAAWDPRGGLNPGIVVGALSVDDDLRVDPRRETMAIETLFAYPEDDGDFAKAVRRCVGVGKCRSDQGGVMCPSFRATHDERDSTRGRARVLHEMLQGEVVADGWRSHEPLDALDLCLSCKGCKTDCPVNVDMATYKSEFLYHHYKRRLRPIAHYSLGWFPTWARLASFAPRAANAVARSRILRGAGGVTTKRPAPQFAREAFREWFGRQPATNHGRRVLLWPDTFTNYLTPNVGIAATKVLNAAGYDVVLPPDKKLCCGLTYVSTGQLGIARRVMRRSIEAIAPFVSEGVPMIGLEPSCTAVFRSDARELLDDDRASLVAESTFTLAEFLDQRVPDWELPRVESASLTQTHCHQHAIIGFTAEERVMERLGLDNTTLDEGCCGLAGNFGFEADHYDVSVAVAEHGLMPEIRAAAPETLVLADGFSCRTQISHLSGRTSLHLAELIAENLGETAPVVTLEP